MIREASSLLEHYSLVTLAFVSAVAPMHPPQVLTWPGKSTVTFSDAVVATRQWLRENWVLENVGGDQAFSNLPPKVKEIILTGLAAAA